MHFQCPREIHKTESLNAFWEGREGGVWGGKKSWGKGKREERKQLDTSEGHFFFELGQIKKEASKSDVQTTFPV